MQTVDQMADAIVKREGDKYTNDPIDKGGPTRNGVTLAYMRGKGIVTADLNHDGKIDERDVQMVSPEIAKQYYISDFFLAPHFNWLPAGLHAVCFDMAVNHGPHRAIQLLQKALGLPADGAIGPYTRQAAEAAIAKLGFKAVENAVVNAREAFYNAIIAQDPSQAKYRDGWLHRAEEFRV